jgi:hypothetical protein
MLAPGATTTMTVHLTPTGHRGQTVSGDLFVDDWVADALYANELGAIPYRYRVG